MGTKLYVANLPSTPSAIALRAHFSACGVVTEVQIMPARLAGRGRDSAFVRMSNAAGAERARSELNGALFAGQLLLVEGAPDDGATPRDRVARRAERGDGESKPHITSQFREPRNMTYELACSGVELVVRVFFADGDGQWRIAAQAGREANAPSTSATAPSRLQAFRNLAQACSETATELTGVDWPVVEDALLKVRAL